MGYKTVRCTECDSLLWSDRAKSIKLCHDCENVDSDDNADLEGKLESLMTDSPIDSAANQRISLLMFGN